VHDLHVWTVSPGYVALSAHVVLADRSLAEAQSVQQDLKQVLVERFDIHHTTIQFECVNCGQGTLTCADGG
jgi:cobalt-zinc-cadmium efflux system protein